MKRKTKAQNCAIDSPDQLHPELKAYVGYCLHKLGLRARASFDRRIAKYDLIAPMYIMLKLLRIEGKMTQVELGKYMAIDKATMVRMIDGLEERKFLKRIQHETDRRAKLLELSETGKKVVAAIEKDSQGAEAALLAPLNQSEREQLRRLIAKILDVPSY